MTDGTAVPECVPYLAGWNGTKTASTGHPGDPELTDGPTDMGVGSSDGE